MLEIVPVAAVSVDNRPGETSQNLRHIDDWSAKAAAAGARLALFQELSITGFVPNHPREDHDRWLRAALVEARRIAEPVPGPAVDSLVRSASKHQILIAAGLLEDAGNLLFNTHVLVGAEGLLGAWRKMHVPMYEMPFYNGGDAPRVVDTPLGRVGVNICFDALLPESTRLLAVQNVEIVLFPFAADPPPPTPQSWETWAAPALRGRCIANGVFGLACNYVGRVACSGVEQTFPGGGLAIGPRGEVLAQWSAAAGSPGMMMATFTAESLRAARAEPEYLFRFRRPELYRPLAE
jgi:predicted amidohydrolase